jgi:RNA polymerase sigma factor (sigma-70 family)
MRMFGENLIEEPGSLDKTGELTATGEPTDRELLERFVRTRDDAAFAAIVERHGPMVLGVCRRVLPNPEDADDAFQATFLVLVHKADSLLDPDLLAGWLYGVAYRTAQNARAEAARRSQHERRATPVLNDAETEESMQRLLALLDEELQRLPEKYRAPLVLCYLEGKTHVEAARQLGWPVGSMSARLARGRTMLKNRLTARQQALLVALFAGVWESKARAAQVPRPLADATVQSAVGLAREEGRRRAAPSPSVSALVAESLRTLSAGKRGGVAAVLLVIGAAVAIGSGIGYASGPFDPAPAAQPAGLEAPPPSTGGRLPPPLPSPSPGAKCNH